MYISLNIDEGIYGLCKHPYSHEHRHGYLHMCIHHNSGNMLVALYELATALSSSCLLTHRVGNHTDAYI